jgi:transposase
LLKQVKGVGELIALTYVLTIDDPHRFRKSRDAGCFVGLQPGRRNSGDSDLAGSGERAAITLTRVTGYRRSPGEHNDAQLFAQTRTLRIRQTNGLDISIADSTSPLRTVPILP